MTLIRAKQVSEILGVSLPQVYAKAGAGVWPSYRIAGMRGVRFKESEIRGLIKNKIDSECCRRVCVPKLSDDEVRSHVKGVQTRPNVVDRFLHGRP